MELFSLCLKNARIADYNMKNSVSQAVIIYVQYE